MKLHSLLYLAALMTLVAPAKAEVVHAATHPLDNWQWRNPLPTGSPLNSVAYGNGGYIAVGNGGAIFRSPDAIQWSRCMSGTNESLSKIVFANDVFVAAGRNGSLLHSADGLNWSQSVSSSTDTFTGLAYGSGFFVAVAIEGSIFRSTDGVNWVSTGLPGETRSLSDVAFGIGEFLAVAWGGSLRSVDGITWSADPITAYRVAFCNDEFVVSSGGGTQAFGNGVFIEANGIISRSEDGINWSWADLPYTDAIYNVDFVNGRFVLLHTGPYGNIHSSTDGLNWQASNAGYDPNNNPSGNAIAFNGERFVSTDYLGIYYSDTGKMWHLAATGPSNCVAYGNGVFVALGARSMDGVTWTSTNIQFTATSVSFLANEFFALNPQGETWHSPDGLSWTRGADIPRTFNFGRGPKSITHGNGLYVAVGAVGLILSSPDGVVWTNHSASVIWDNPEGDRFFSVSDSRSASQGRPPLNSIAYANGRFVTVGEAGAIATSEDGLNWISPPYQVNLGFNLTGVTVLNGYYVACGEGGVLRSPDGYNWTLAQAEYGNWQGIAAGRGTAVVVGSVGIAQSGPGIDKLSPDSVTGDASAFTLTVHGGGFIDGAEVRWDGHLRPTTFVDDATLTAQIEGITATADLSTVAITVKNPGGAASFEAPFVITSTKVTAVQSAIAGAGATASVSTAPTESSGTPSGISATVLNSGDATPVTVSAASYSSNPSSSTVFDVAGNSELAGNFLDLQVKDADPQDQLAANFYYPSTVTGEAESSLTLKYYNGADWVGVVSSGHVAPAKNTTDNLDDTVSGGRFEVHFDTTSTPKITELGGTFFAAAIARPPLGFAGFLAPIGGADASGGSFANPLRTFKAGSTVPVKFTASRDGTAVATGIHRLQAVKHSDATTAGLPIDATPQEAATSGNQFVLKGGEWHFNLDTKTTGLTKGIWQLVTTLSDGTQHRVWIQIK